jgi:hypothetical protein
MLYKMPWAFVFLWVAWEWIVFFYYYFCCLFFCNSDLL